MTEGLIAFFFGILTGIGITFLFQASLETYVENELKRRAVRRKVNP